MEVRYNLPSSRNEICKFELTTKVTEIKENKADDLFGPVQDVADEEEDKGKGKDKEDEEINHDIKKCKKMKNKKKRQECRKKAREAAKDKDKDKGKKKNKKDTPDNVVKEYVEITPVIDLVENDQEFLIIIEVPGLKKKNIKVSYTMNLVRGNWKIVDIIYDEQQGS